MNDLHIKYHWLGRIIASDPGRKRFQKAGKATISLISAVFATMFVLLFIGKDPLAPAIVSGMVGMISIMVVMDDTRRKKKITTLLMGVSAILGITLGTLLSGNTYCIDILMILVIFSSFYFTRFGVRYFSLSMVAFMMIYISSILTFPIKLLPYFYVGVIFGTTFAYVYNFVLFKDSAQILKNSLRSFHIQSNLTFNLLIKGIQDTDYNPKRLKYLKNNVHKLKEYAREVTTDLNEQDLKEVWPGLTTSQLRLYVFDTGMLVETLSESVHKLKQADALEIEELRRLLIWVVKTLRDAEVLAPTYEKQNLEEAEKAIQALRLVLKELLNREEEPKGWLFIIRRIESIVNHVIKGAISIQQSVQGQKDVGNDLKIHEETSDDEFEESEEKEQGLKPSTKKAYQAIVAGILSIIVGQIISPTQPYWVLLTAFIVLLGTESIGRTYLKGFQRSFGTIIGAFLGFGLAKLVSGHSIIEIILIFIVVFFAYYLFAVSYTLMSMFITMLIAFMYDILLGGITLELLGARVVDTIAGAAIAFAVSYFIFPKRTKDKVDDALDDFLSELKPYVTEYVRGFREDVNVKDLAESAIKLDQKLQMIKDESRTLIQRTNVVGHSRIGRWITICTAINYYARHLVASSYRKNFDFPEELVTTFKQIEEKLDHNIGVLRKLLKRNERAIVYSLSKERERIERLAPSRYKSNHDLIHHLYYIWRINKSIITLCEDLGAEKK